MQIASLLCVTGLFLNIIGISGLTVTLSGSESYGVEGRSFRFTCTVTDEMSVPGNISFGRIDETPLLSFSSSCAVFLSNPGYSPSCGQSGLFYMSITTVRIEDGANWYCSFGSDHSNTIFLPVYYGPSNLRLDETSPVTVNEFSNLRVECNGTCRPTCNFTWKKGTKVVSSNRILSLTNISRNHDGDYVCIATNDKTGRTASSSLKLVVSCFTVRLTGSHTYAELGKAFRFTCTVTCDENRFGTVAFNRAGGAPVSAFTPSCSTGASDAGYSYSCGQSDVYYMSISSVRAADAATWKCTRRSQKSNSLVIPVYHGPEQITLGKSSPLTLREFSTLTVTCSATCDPCSFTWKKGITTLSDTQKLSQTTINRNQAGDYNCTATNTQTGTSKSSSLTVIIQYKPTISGIESSYPVTESSPLEINCSRYTTPGNPSTTSYRWTGPGSYTSNGPVLSISSISRTQTGQYNCTATNSLTPTGGPPQQGTATGHFQVEVRYPAVITAYTINSNTNTVKVNESDSVTMRCQVDSNPRSTIRLYNESKELSKEDNTVTHEHRWIADCRQRGNYSCTADNNIGSSGTATRLIHLAVSCSPRLDETYPVTPYYASSIGSDISLSVILLSYPKPVILWTKVNDSSHRNLTSISSESLKSDVSVTASLHLNDIQQDDFGEYTIQCANEVGSSQTYTIYLLPKGPPSGPTNLTVLEKGKYNLHIAWKQEFNRGDSQTFSVEYSTDDLRWQKAGTSKETGSGQYLHFEITGLAPQTLYYVRVAASNKFGVTYTSRIRTFTQEENTVSAVDARAGLIAGVTVGMLSLIAAVVIVVLLLRRGFRTAPAKNRNELTEDQLQGDIVALSQGDGQVSSQYALFSDREADKQTYTELTAYVNTKTEDGTSTGGDGQLVNPYAILSGREAEKETYTELTSYENTRTRTDKVKPYTVLSDKESDKETNTELTSYENIKTKEDDCGAYEPFQSRNMKK